MKEQYARLMIGFLALILVISGMPPSGEHLAWAQGEESGKSPDSAPLAPSVSISPTMSYQGKLVESGSPVSGNRSMTFRLFTASSGGVAIWTEGPKTVSVNNGLFTVTLGDTTPFIMNTLAQKLYLEIEVAGIILPRQVMQGVPYALSLAPGAYATGNLAQSVFNASNSGSGNAISAISSSGDGTYGLSAAGHGVHAQGLGSGLSGSALFAESLNTTNGVALLGYNHSTDVTAALSNDGTGDLLKGFGSDGGEDEFRFENDGTFQDKAPSYIFVPGTEAMLEPPSTSSGVVLEPFWGGEPCVSITRTTIGVGSVVFGVAMPAVLYGQPVEVEEVRIYYKTSNTRSYIFATHVHVRSETGVEMYMAEEAAVHNSTSFIYYTLVPDTHQVLSETQGNMSVSLGLHFGDPSDNIYLCGLRLRLRHHSLY